VSRKFRLRYATGSQFKAQEIETIRQEQFVLDPNRNRVLVLQLFDIILEAVKTDEPLERNIDQMVIHKVKSAYRKLLMPCIVEHAGLIIESLLNYSYPGGLTQPMWDAIGAEGFLRSHSWAGERATTRAVVGYCDGLNIHTFVGETKGVLAKEPRGAREFYWDTIFCPDGGEGLTYAEISGISISKKVELSQSTKAMIACLNYVVTNGTPMFVDAP
jgi:XTP/dITP diphosphohydrolase